MFPGDRCIGLADGLGKRLTVPALPRGLCPATKCPVAPRPEDDLGKLSWDGRQRPTRASRSSVRLDGVAAL